MPGWVWVSSWEKVFKSLLTDDVVGAGNHVKVDVGKDFSLFSRWKVLDVVG